MTVGILEGIRRFRQKFAAHFGMRAEESNPKLYDELLRLSMDGVKAQIELVEREHRADLDSMEQIRKMRHDLKHHLAVLSALLEENGYDGHLNPNYRTTKSGALHGYGLPGIRKAAESAGGYVEIEYTHQKFRLTVALPIGEKTLQHGTTPVCSALNTTQEQGKFPFLSLNFVDGVSGKPVYQPYIIVERDGIKIAFVGVSTPKTLTSSRPTYFMDENGNYNYSFLQDESGKKLWDAVQQTVDAAKKDGADYVIALTHLGIDTATAPYLSTEMIAGTSGIDVVLDGHSHSVVECERVRNKDGKRVLLSSTGTALNHIGFLLIDRDGNLSTGLVSDYTQKDADISAYINGLKAESEQQLKQPVMNGGGIRAGLKTGEITYGDVLGVFPFGNHLRTIEVTGQQLLDALELSVSEIPEENGGFGTGLRCPVGFSDRRIF